VRRGTGAGPVGRTALRRGTGTGAGAARSAVRLPVVVAALVVALTWVLAPRGALTAAALAPIASPVPVAPPVGAAPASNPAAAYPATAYPAAAFDAAAADRALVEKVLAASRVDRQPAPPDASYWRDLLAALAANLGRLAAQASGRLNLPWWLLAGAVALLALGATALLAVDWSGRRREAQGAPGRQETGAAAGARGDGGGAAAAAWGAAAWRRELDRRLAEERVAEALRATWWWLARSLAGARAEPTWTGRELLRWSRRDDLRELVRQLDVLTYGPRPARCAEVRRLALRLEAALE